MRAAQRLWDKREETSMGKLPHYTVVLEFAGGTYISQIRAPNEVAALKKWIRNPQSDMLKGVRYANKRDLWISRIELDDEINTLTALDKVKNVWYFSFVQGKQSGYVNVIKTDVS